MITKNRRLAIITELVNTHSPNSQGKLLKLLHDKGFAITQTTLSRDIKQLKIGKMPDERGNYVYMTSPQETGLSTLLLTKNKKDKFGPLSNRGFISIEFSHHLAVIKTRPGFASILASNINNHNHVSSIILGAIASEDTLLLIPREGITSQEVLDMLVKVIPGFKKESEKIKTSK